MKMSVALACAFSAFVLGVQGVQAAAKGPYSVKLKRQQIPLHTDGGVVHHKSAYYGQVSMGGPTEQLFEVVFDTGSGHLVLPSTLCKSATCKKHRRYKRKSSSLARDIDCDGTPVDAWQARDQITVSFGTGEVTGIFVQDQLCLGPMRKSEGSTQGASLLQRDVGRVKKTNASEDQVAASAEEKPQGCVDLRFISSTEMT